MVTLETVEIPGYADAVRHEAEIRDTAFLDSLQSLCGIEVAPLCLRRLIWLEQARNGLVLPWRFDSDEELLVAAMQVIWFCRPEFTPPTSPKYGFWKTFLEGRRYHNFGCKVLLAHKPEKVVQDVQDWLTAAFMDAPTGSMDGVPTPSYASFPAYIVDRFAEAKLPFSYSEIMGMPLPRLWQHLRIATRRISGTSLTNPSDIIRVNFIAGRVA